MARKKVLSIEEALELRQVSDPQLSPDGRQVVFVVSELDRESKKRYQNLWLVPAGGGAMRRLTTSATRDVEPRWSPDGRQIAFVSNRAGAGQGAESGTPPQVWLLPVDGGEARRLTGMDSSVFGIEWSPDGQRILFMSPETPGEEEKKLRERGGIQVADRFHKMRQVWVVEVESGKCRQLTRDRSSKGGACWSPDGKRIAYEQRKTPTSNHSYRASLWVMDADGKHRRRLSEGKFCDTAPRWSPDGKRIAFLRRESCYFYLDELVVMPVEGGRVESLTGGLDRGVQGVNWSVDGKKLFFLVQDGVRQHAHVVDAKNGKVRRLTGGDRVLSSLSVGGGRMAFISGAPDRCGQVCAAATSGKGEKRLTEMNPLLEKRRLGRTRVVGWKSSDRLAVEGLLVLPADGGKGKRLPLIVEPHGGPCGCRTCDFSPRWQALAGKGYAVFSPNFRGSAGYGQEFACANGDDFGGGDFADLMSGVDMLVEEGIADPERLGIMGYSYGGFMTCWAIGQTDRFKGAAVGAGVTNLQSFFGTTDIQWFTREYQRGNPWEKPEGYAAQSPMTYVGRVKTPTLIYHGDEDRRVPMEQSEQLYVALRERGVEVEFVRYPREGHGLGEYWHQLDELERSSGWMDRYLKGKK